MQPRMARLKYLFLFVISLHMTVTSGTNSTCGCYMLGTLGSIDGESLCNNKTLQCRCYRNVIGKNCDRCSDGFYNILSGRGCSSCLCSALGSVNKSCNTLTGQCQCKTGFTGFRCDQCELNTYKYSSKKCQNCNCNPFGSKDLQCNIVGLCPCLPNAEGKLCDHCKENTYSIEKGCIPCPPCYEFVQSAIKNYTEYLNTIKEAIEEIENKFPLLVQDYIHFWKEIKRLETKIDKLKSEYEDADKTVLAEAEINKLTKQAEDFHNEVLNLIQQFDEDLYKSKIKNALYVGRTNLKDANNLVIVCEDALVNATKIDKSLNRHNKTITLIAKDTLKTLQKIEEEAEELYQTSINVNSSCNEACNTAETYLKNQQTLNNELDDIKSDILNTTDGIEAMKTYSEGFLETTKKTKKAAHQLSDEANLLIIPDTEKVSAELNEINDSMTSINEATKNLIEEANIIKEKEKSTEDYIEQVKSKQKNINDYFSLVQSYDERASIAIDTSNNVFKTAQESLKNLEKFKEIKETTEAALQHMPDIRAKVDAVLNNSDEIENIFRELLTVIRDLEKMQVIVDEILNSDQDHKAQIGNNFRTLEEMEQKQRETAQKLAESHGKLKDINRNLNNAQKFQIEIEKNITRMEEYIVVLNTLPTTVEELDEVEEEIMKMEDMVLAMEYLTREKKKLQEEMENIKDIIESIPIEDSSLCESAKSEPK